MSDYEDGFYWVRTSEDYEWEAAFCESGRWWMPGAPYPLYTGEIATIGPKLTPPSEETE